MGRWLSLVMIVILAACGGKDGASITVDAAADPTGTTDTTGDSPDQCAATCVTRECGDDGCGGNCGGCQHFLEHCTDAGSCEAFPCKSSKDCPGSLVCAEGISECVACVGDEDCPDGEVCGADHECHAPLSCDSDKDCKSQDMICDKNAGLCVECLKNVHCADDMYCDEGYCIESICSAGESKCDGSTVLACPDGSEWVVKQTCGVAQYCEGATCHDGCEPSAVWCEGDFYKVCADDGKSVQYEEDCAEKGQHCFGGACIDTICAADSTFCVDNNTAAACAEDGMSFNEVDCPAENYCDDGSCKLWVCEPGMATCFSNIAQMCNAAGSGFTSETNCNASGKKCVNGQCIELACPPGAAFCVDNDTVGACALDGLSFESVDCGAQQSCDAGICTSWSCTPNEPMCDGNVATTCDSLGLGPLAGGINCTAEAKACSQGQCLLCEPQCGDKECGNDGCGGSCGDCVVAYGELYVCTEGTCECPQNCGDNACVTDTDCVDANPCTVETCNEGSCHVEPLLEPQCACQSNGDCTGKGGTCSPVSTGPSSVGTYCGPPVGPKVSGAMCTEDEECQSGYCAEVSEGQICYGACITDQDCGVPDICGLVEFLSADGLTKEIAGCIPPDLDCHGDSQCKPSEVCVPVESEGLPNTLQTFCSNPVGSKSAGSICSNDNNCQSGLCFDLAEKGIDICWATCNTDSDCLPGLFCYDSIHHFIFDQDTPTLKDDKYFALPTCAPFLGSFQNCSADVDCPGNEFCSWYSNKTWTALEPRCISSKGNIGPGGNCSADSQCKSNICLTPAGFCMGLCKSSGGCSGGTSCQEYPEYEFNPQGDVTSIYLCLP